MIILNQEPNLGFNLVIIRFFLHTLISCRPNLAAPAVQLFGRNSKDETSCLQLFHVEINMKKTLLTLAIGLGLASNAAFAKTGSINFYGQVHAGTCPIEIIDPSTGLPVARINMGNVSVSQFENPGDEAALRAFGMRITPGSGGCTIPSTKKTQVTFTGAYGGAGTGGALYALEPGGAKNLALTIKDNDGTPVVNGQPSKEYPLDDAKPTTMIFSVAYKSVGADVSAGTANTDVQFLVDIP